MLVGAEFPATGSLIENKMRFEIIGDKTMSLLKQ